jgi:hypothetical protein
MIAGKFGRNVSNCFLVPSTQQNPTQMTYQTYSVAPAPGELDGVILITRMHQDK